MGKSGSLRDKGTVGRAQKAECDHWPTARRQEFLEFVAPSLSPLSSVLLEKEIWIESVACFSFSMVEALKSPFSFCRDSSLDLRICTGVAMGLQRPIGTLSPFNDGSHSYYVDDVFSWRMERSGGGSPQSGV